VGFLSFQSKEAESYFGVVCKSYFESKQFEESRLMIS
jgi:hypothetical protein